MKKKVRRGSVQIADEVERIIEKFTNGEIANKSLSNVAAEIGISYQHLTRAYFKARGKRLTDFFNENKIKRAELLLRRYPRIKIKKVSELLGYSSESYFTKTFREHYLVAPALTHQYFRIRCLKRKKFGF